MRLFCLQRPAAPGGPFRGLGESDPRRVLLFLAGQKQKHVTGAMQLNTIQYRGGVR